MLLKLSDVQIRANLAKSFTKFEVDGKLACACSGGADSLAMTVIAAGLYDVVALIIDHGIRDGSKREAARTAKILGDLNIENVILTNDVKIKSNLQENARLLRYQLLTDYCLENGISQLATAHHADDNAETFLLRLSRGSGVDGLSAIPEVTEYNGVKIIRPLLKVTKVEITDFLTMNKIDWVEDPTNQKNIYKRNKLRNVLENLEDKELITKRLNETAINMSRVRDFLEIETAKAYDECVSHNEFTPAVIDILKFKKLHDEIAYRVLVKLIMKVSGSLKKPRFEKLKRLKDDLLNVKPRTLNGLIFQPKKNLITIEIEKSSKKAYISQI